MNNSKNSKIMIMNNNNKSYKSYNIRKTSSKSNPTIKLFIYIALFGFFFGMMVLLIISINKNITEITDNTTMPEECERNMFELYNSNYCGKDNFKQSKLIGYSVLVLLFFIFIILFLIGIISTVRNIRKHKKHFNPNTPK